MNIWEEIKSKLDIVDVISEYVPVSPSGSNYRASSPFKKEKTPSLMISQQKQIWHDFSSGKGGDIFGFVMEVENTTRGEALKKLATKAGVTLTNIRPETAQSEEQKTLHTSGLEALTWSAELYNTILKKILKDRSHPVTQYCIERKLTPTLIEQFGIGYAPKQNFLLQLLNRNKTDTRLFEETQLIVSRNGVLKDKFSDRLMIPINNTEGKVVGFTGRILPYDTSERPKYLNSSQSQWFDKSKIWFGLNLARKNIMLEKKAIVVEGNMDVVAAFGADLCYAVASQGTSFTSTQLSLLKRFTQTVLLAFDNDSAGVLASYKFFMQATPIGITVRQVVIPKEYKDLDDFLKFQKPEQLESEFYLEKWLDDNRARLNSSESSEQKTAINEYCVLLTVVDDITKEQFVQRLSTITGISTTTLTKLVANLKSSVRSFEVKQQYANSVTQSGIEQSTTTTAKEDMLITWQKTAALYTKDNDQVYRSIFDALYPVLLVLAIVKEPDLDGYLNDRNDELLMVAESLHEDQSKLNMLKSLERMIDSQVGLLLHEDAALSSYYLFKQLLQQL